MLIPRIITAIFLVGFMLGGLFYLPAAYWPAFAALIILPALWEWARLFRITGLAQAKIRSEGTPEQRLALDLQYVREASVMFDLKILVWTLGRLTGKGSN